MVVKGWVRDEASKPIENATVYHLPSGKHVHSDKTGYFEFRNAMVGDTLAIYQVGFLDLKVAIAGEEIIEIRLINKPVSLEDVIIVQEQSQRDVISGIDLATRPVSNSQELLRNVPGLVIGQH